MKNTSDPKTYSVIATGPDGWEAIVTHKGRFRWSKRTARKHAREFAVKHGHQTKLVEE